MQVFADGRPAAGADVTALSPDGARGQAVTDDRGRATLDLRPGHLPVRVSVRKDGFAACEEPAWIPDERALHVRLAQPAGAHGVGSP